MAAAVQLLSVEALTAYVVAAGRAAGVPESQVDLLAASFVEADLRGVETHGVFRVPAYVRAFRQGRVNPAPNVSVVRDSGAALLLDGDNGLGMVVGQIAMDRAIERAHEHGVGAVSVRNSNHSGMLAIHVLRAARRNLVGYFTSGGAAIMAAWGGSDPVLSNGPFAWGIPREGAEPLVVDMSSSAAARGKIRSIAATRGRIPEGWALDGAGRPTTDSVAAMEGVVLPMAGHKGYGIALANDVVSSGLAGANLAVEAPREFLKEGSTVLDAWGIGHFALVLDPAAFAGLPIFDSYVERLVAAIGNGRLAEGTTRVMLPGQPEAERRAERLANGIPVPDRVLRLLDEFAEEIGIDPPARS